MSIKLFLLMRSFENSTSREIHKMAGCLPKRKGKISTERMVVKRKNISKKSLVISVGVSKLLFFFGPGVKITGQYQKNELLACMHLEMNNLSRGDYIFLPDGARFHTAKATLEYLNENCPAYVKPGYWYPNSPDLNVLDFVIWGNFEKFFLGKQTA